MSVLIQHTIYLSMKELERIQQALHHSNTLVLKKNEKEGRILMYGCQGEEEKEKYSVRRNINNMTSASKEKKASSLFFFTSSPNLYSLAE